MIALVGWFMGDMGEIFRDMKERKKAIKQSRHLSADSYGWKKHTEYHWFRYVDGNKLEYWPSTGLCMYQGRKCNIDSRFIKNLIGDN